MKKESIKLTPAQRQSIEQILSKGKALAWTLKHAQVLLKVDRGSRGQAGPPRKLWKPLTLFSLCCSLAVNSLRIPWDHPHICYWWRSREETGAHPLTWRK